MIFSISVVFHFRICVIEAEDRALDERSKFFRQPSESFHMPADIVCRGKEDGVVPPDDPFFADGVSQGLQCADALADVRQILFDVFSVRVQCVLKIKGIAFADFRQVRQERPGVFCPEHDAVQDGRG